MELKIALLIIFLLIAMCGLSFLVYTISDEIVLAMGFFAFLTLIVLTFMACFVTNQEYQKQETTVDKIQDNKMQNINIYINGAKVTTQEETVNSQDNSYSVLISGTAINPQNINLNDCDFSVDTQNHRITIFETGTEAGVKNSEPYEIHINGSDINIENLNLNDFTISVDEENRWIVLTKK